MTESKTFKQLLFGLVKQVKLDMEKQFAKAKIQITPFQYGILAMLKHEQPTLAALAHRLGVRPPSLVPPIDSLVRQGYVHRLRDKSDRRKIHLSITPAAQKLFAKMHQDHPTDSLNVAFHKLSKPKQKQLISLLSELNQNLS